MDRGAWWATAHRVTKSRTRLKWFSVPKKINVLSLLSVSTPACRLCPPLTFCEPEAPLRSVLFPWTWRHQQLQRSLVFFSVQKLCTRLLWKTDNQQRPSAEQGMLLQVTG